MVRPRACGATPYNPHHARTHNKTHALSLAKRLAAAVVLNLCTCTTDATHRCRKGGLGVSVGGARGSPPQLLLFLQHSGLGNQELALRLGLQLALASGRQLVVPPIMPHNMLAFGDFRGTGRMTVCGQHNRLLLKQVQGEFSEVSLQSRCWQLLLHLMLSAFASGSMIASPCAMENDCQCRTPFARLASNRARVCTQGLDLACCSSFLPLG